MQLLLSRGARIMHFFLNRCWRIPIIIGILCALSCLTVRRVQIFKTRWPKHKDISMPSRLQVHVISGMQRKILMFRPLNQCQLMAYFSLQNESWKITHFQPFRVFLAENAILQLSLDPRDLIKSNQVPNNIPYYITINSFEGSLLTLSETLYTNQQFTFEEFGVKMGISDIESVKQNWLDS